MSKWRNGCGMTFYLLILMSSKVTAKPVTVLSARATSGRATGEGRFECLSS